MAVGERGVTATGVLIDMNPNDANPNLLHTSSDVKFLHKSSGFWVVIHHSPTHNTPITNH